MMRRRVTGMMLLLVLVATLARGRESDTFLQKAAMGPPPGKMIDVGGHRLHIYCVGEGSPSVVIDGGAGTWSIFYSHIQAAIKDTRVCVYDRAGLGWSDPGPKPRTSSRMAEELHTLLHHAGIVPPLVLVGHSLGGYDVRIYQQRYPEEVGALVLVESGHEKQWERLPGEVSQLLTFGVQDIRASAGQARAGKIDSGKIDLSLFTRFAPQFREAYLAGMQTPQPYETWADESQAALESASQVPAGHNLGDLPLIVLTAEKSFEAFRGAPIPIDDCNVVWMKLQNELASLSRNSTHLFSKQGTHDLHKTDPEAFVAAIRLGIEAARKYGNFPGSLGLPDRSLPLTSTSAVDQLLLRLEESYRTMDADRFVALFTDDLSQLDVTRRVHIKGRLAWLEHTRQVNSAHLRMDRRHRGRAIIADWIVAEIEWSGTIRGEVLGTPGRDRNYRYTGLGLMRLHNGKIQQQILYGDSDALREQLPVKGAHTAH